MEAGQAADRHRTPHIVAHQSSVYHKIHEINDHLPGSGQRRAEAPVLRYGAPSAKVTNSLNLPLRTQLSLNPYFLAMPAKANRANITSV